MFSKKNLAMPDNKGEIKVALDIIKDIGYEKGLCQLLNTDKETGIVGDVADLNRRRTTFGKSNIKQASIEPFYDILSR